MASYKDAENFSDTLNLSIKWADIEKAKTSVRNCRKLHLIYPTVLEPIRVRDLHSICLML